MPFLKTREVPNEFFNLFLNRATDKQIIGDNRFHPMLPITVKEETKDFLVRYFNRSGESGVEDLMEYVPCVIIQDFQPELNRTRLFGMSYETGYFDKDTNKLEKIYLPIPYTYRFQVSAITGRLSDNYAIQDWFNEEFLFNSNGFFMMNQLLTEEGTIGDVVPYIVEMQDVPREDNRFESSYMFTLQTYLHAKAKNYSIDDAGNIIGGNFEDVYQKLSLKLSQRDLKGYKELLHEEFIVP